VQLKLTRDMPVPFHWHASCRRCLGRNGKLQMGQTPGFHVFWAKVPLHTNINEDISLSHAGTHTTVHVTNHFAVCFKEFLNFTYITRRRKNQSSQVNLPVETQHQHNLLQSHHRVKSSSVHFITAFRTKAQWRPKG
jgi:hypothetical protein